MNRMTWNFLNFSKIEIKSAHGRLVPMKCLCDISMLTWLLANHEFTRNHEHSRNIQLISRHVCKWDTGTMYVNTQVFNYHAGERCSPDRFARWSVCDSVFIGEGRWRLLTTHCQRWYQTVKLPKYKQGCWFKQMYQWKRCNIMTICRYIQWRPY